MSQQELLKAVIRVLDDTGIPYMVTGSFVSSLQGEPRSTHDIDLLVAIKPDDAYSLAEAFPPPHFYLNEDSVVDAIKRRDMFNLLDSEGDKVDFWMLKDEPFDRSRFSRRCMQDVLGLEIAVSSPEDTILAKLKWAKICGGSEKQFGDALSVYELQHPNLDIEYIERWVNELDIEPLWRRLQDEAEVL